MYDKVSTNLNFVEREKKTEQFWKDNDIFRKSMENRKIPEDIDYDKVEVQVIKKNGKVSEIIYTCGDETIHLPIKEDNSND